MGLGQPDAPASLYLYGRQKSRDETETIVRELTGSDCSLCKRKRHGLCIRAAIIKVVSCCNSSLQYHEQLPIDNVFLKLIVQHLISLGLSTTEIGRKRGFFGPDGATDGGFSTRQYIF